MNALVIGGVVELTVLLMLLAAPFLVLWRTGINDEPARYGRAFAVAVTLVFLCSGMLNILFAHDLMDHLYIVTMALAARLAIPDNTPGQIEKSR